MNPLPCTGHGKIELQAGFRRDIGKNHRMSGRTDPAETAGDDEAAVGKLQNQSGDQEVERTFRNPFFRLRLGSGANRFIAAGIQMTADFLPPADIAVNQQN